MDDTGVRERKRRGPKPGYRQTPEHRENLSRAMRGRAFSDAHVAAMTEGQRRRRERERLKKLEEEK